MHSEVSLVGMQRARPDRRLDRSDPLRSELGDGLLGRRHGDIPIWGSDEWEALPSDDPRRFASVIRAAEAWRLDGEPDAAWRRLDEDDALVQLRVHEAGSTSTAAATPTGFGSSTWCGPGPVGTCRWSGPRNPGPPNSSAGRRCRREPRNRPGRIRHTRPGTTRRPVGRARPVQSRRARRRRCVGGRSATRFRGRPATVADARREDRPRAGRGGDDAAAACRRRHPRRHLGPRQTSGVPRGRAAASRGSAADLGATEDRQDPGPTQLRQCMHQGSRSSTGSPLHPSTAVSCS